MHRDTTVRALLQETCNIKHISFTSTNHIYTVTAETHSLDMIPSVAHLGLKKFERGQPFLLIWPICLDLADLTSEDDFHMKIMQDQEDARLGMSKLHRSFFFRCKV